MPKHGDIDKILVIGSGPVFLGQAGELDQASVQACDALRSMGYQLVIAHSDPAAVITDLPQKDHVYIEPLDINSLSCIINIENPDAILALYGGQTALNLIADLSESEIFSKNKIRLLDLSSMALNVATDRLQLKALSLPEHITHSRYTCADSTTQAISEAEKINYPLVIRSHFQEPGLGNTIAYNVEELRAAVNTRLVKPHHQKIMLEESHIGSQEMEIVVMRDQNGNKAICASLENLEPVGIHHGDSVVTLPCQSLPVHVLKQLETAGTSIIEALKLIGIASIRFAVHPDTYKIVLLDITPQASDSTSLASLATRLPLHRMAALLAGGMLLDELALQPNSDSDLKRFTVEQTVVKFPCWAFDTFKEAPDRLDIHMQAVGEVVGIGANFNTAFQKALRSLSLDGSDYQELLEEKTGAHIGHRPKPDFQSSKRYFHLIAALRAGDSVASLNQTTKINTYFLEFLKELAEIEKAILSQPEKPIDPTLLVKAKVNGFSDTQLAKWTGYSEKAIQKQYQNLLEPSDYLPKAINVPEKLTIKADKSSQVNTYLILGPGSNKLGHGLGFDHSSIQSAKALLDAGHKVVRINWNSASATTRVDSNEVLYIEPLQLEEIVAVYKDTMAQGVFVQFSGPQIAYWAEKLRQAGMRVIGIEPETFDILTNCTKFRSLINELGMAQPDFEIVKTPFHLFEAMKRIKYPVLIRPEEKTFPQVTDSILVISDDLTMRRHFDPENQQAFATPYMVEHFFEFAIECEVDALYDGKEVFIPTVLEHIELAGVHSTDSACVTPPYCIPLRHVETIYEYARKILHKLNFKGLMTIRFSIINDTVYVLEATPWANRTLPLTSKICNIPMAYAATQILLGKSLADLKLKPPRLPYFGVREAVFPFANFPQVDPLLGPQVYSTGSVLALSDSFGLSYFKSQEAILMPLPLEGSVLITVTDADKPSILEPARLFKEMGFRIKATKGTQQFLKKHGIAAETVRKLGFGRPNLVDAIKTGEVDLVINTPSGKQSQIDDADIRKAAIQCKVPNITTPAGALAAAKGIAARLKGRPKVKSLKEYYDLF